MSIQAEFERLEISEKIRVLHKLWDQIASSPANVPVPEWHRAELNRREQERLQNGEQTESWAAVEKRLRASLLTMKSGSITKNQYLDTQMTPPIRNPISPNKIKKISPGNRTGWGFSA